jgi:hypothetical protein
MEHQDLWIAYSVRRNRDHAIRQTQLPLPTTIYIHIPHFAFMQKPSRAKHFRYSHRGRALVCAGENPSTRMPQHETMQSVIHWQGYEAQSRINHL